MKTFLGITIVVAACGGKLDLRTLPETVIVDNRELALTADLVRGRGWGQPTAGPLEAGVVVYAKDGGGLPTGLDAMKLYVFRKSEVWETNLHPCKESTPTRIARCAVDDGPRWDFLTPVDVVVELRAGGGAPAYVSSHSVLIQEYQ